MSEIVKPAAPGCRFVRVYRYYHLPIEEVEKMSPEDHPPFFLETEYSKSGLLLSETEFDDGHPFERMEYERDENERLLEIRQFADEELLTKTVCIYDEKGNRIREERHYASGGTGTTEFGYNSEGRVISKVILEDEDDPPLKEEWEYDEKFPEEISARREWQGDEMRIEVRHLIAETDGKSSIAETHYFHIDLPGVRKIVYHDARTNDDHLYAVTYDHHNRVAEIHRIYYDEQGRPFKEVVKNGETGTLSETVYEFDDQNRIIRESVVLNGTPRQYTINRFDDKGRILYTQNQNFTDRMEYID